MRQEIKAVNHTDDKGNPSGGSVEGVGLLIEWQDGPLGPKENRKEPNGAFVETVLVAALQRLEYYQKSRFNCQENHDAIMYIEKALERLEDRTRGREERKVEGEHKV